MTDIEITHEPLTYRRDQPVSYFRDLALARNGDGSAEHRLQQHASEMRKVIPAREREAEKRAYAAGMEYRVNPNRTDGQGGYFTAPLWLIDEFATAPRLGRVLAALIPNLPLPQAASEVKLPRMTTGTHTAPISDGAAVPSRDIVDAAASQPVTTIAGMSDVALQLLEQSPAGAHLDYAIFTDLYGSYNGQLELALVAGSGVGTNFTGILNLTTGAGGVNAISYTDSTPTGSESMPFDGQAAAQIGDTRFMPPEVWLMRTARWAWLGSAQDTATRPFSTPTLAPPKFPLPPGPNPVGALLGWPVFCDDAIPPTLGGTGPLNGTQDAIIAMRPSDSILLETVQQTDVKMEPLSGEMMARLTLRGYATAIHRYPTGIATITGTGMAVQSGY